MLTFNGHDLSGTTAQRPTNAEIGQPYFDTTLNLSLVWNGTAWQASDTVFTAADALTAVGTNRATSLALTATVNRVATAAAGTGVTLPAAAPAERITIIHTGANPIQVYGAGSDTVNAVAAATGITLMPNSVTMFSCTAAGAWWTDVPGVGFAGSLATMSYADSLTAIGTTQGGALALLAMVNRIATSTNTAAPYNGVSLPAAVAGLEITVVNSSGKQVQVYGSGTDTINGIATATGVTQGAGVVALYCCTTAGAWNVQLNQSSQQAQIALSGASDVISPHSGHAYIVTRAGVDAMTLAAPTSGTDDGLTIVISSNTANAHTLTATGLLQTGTASVNVATFAAQKGAGLTLQAYQGKWNVLAAVGITFS